MSVTDGVGSSVWNRAADLMSPLARINLIKTNARHKKSASTLLVIMYYHLILQLYRYLCISSLSKILDTKYSLLLYQHQPEQGIVNIIIVIICLKSSYDCFCLFFLFKPFCVKSGCVTLLQKGLHISKWHILLYKIVKDNMKRSIITDQVNVFFSF